MGCGNWHGRHGRHEEQQLSDKGFMAVTLDLLEGTPGNGYQVIQGLEARLEDLFTVSPGSVYPVLQLLEDAGFVQVTLDEGKKSYTVTEAGQAYLGERREALDSFWARAERGRQRLVLWELVRELKSLAWEVRESVGERAVEAEGLAEIRAAVARAREVIDKHLAG